MCTLGIERTWAKAKCLYRREVDRLKALNRPFNHMGLVRDVLGQINNEFAMHLAAQSVPATMAAQPIAPLPNELTRGDPRIGTPQYVYHSP